MKKYYIVKMYYHNTAIESEINGRFIEETLAGIFDA